jgi:signal transduction histidine kinase
VADQGQGIAQEDMAHLFKPFYRGRSSRHLQGSGVGLSLVKSIADKYGGNVTVASRQNEGTTVFLRLLKNLIPF